MKEKINYIDYSKGIAILFVIFGHVYSGNNIATTWIYSFHIPLFFIISGFLLKLNKNKDTKSMILKKFKSLMVPYILFSIISILGHYLINDLSYMILKKSIFNTITLFGVEALWFLPALFISESIFLYEKNNIDKNKYKILFYINIFLIIYIFMLIDKKNYNSVIENFTIVLVRSIVALFFINIGYYLYKVISKINLKIYQIFILAIISVVFSKLNGSVNLYSVQFDNLFLYVLNSIIGSFLTISIAKKINGSKALEFLGQNTLIIMATHQLIIEAILKSTLIKYLNGIIFIFIILLLEYPLIKIINKYLPFMLGKKREKSIINKENNAVME